MALSLLIPLITIYTVLFYVYTGVVDYTINPSITVIFTITFVIVPQCATAEITSWQTETI